MFVTPAIHSSNSSTDGPTPYAKTTIGAEQRFFHWPYGNCPNPRLSGMTPLSYGMVYLGYSWARDHTVPLNSLTIGLSR